MIPAAPKLRFSEFKDSWKPGHAGDAFKNSRAKGAVGLPIYSVTMDRGLVRRDSMDRHMAADAADGQNLRAQPGDVVYNMMRMWQGAVGLAPEECMVSPAYVVLSPKKHTSPQFFDQWFKGKRMLYLLGAYSHGITSDRLRLYADDFARIPLHLPSLPEQQKIAAFLGVVDTKLAALATKQAALGQFKAGLMQKLFSQQLRFTRDDGTAFPDWQERRLGDVVRVFSGGTPSASVRAYYSGEIPFIKSGEIAATHTAQFINPLGFKSSSAKMVEKGDILYALYGANSGEVAISKISGAINQAVMCIRTKQVREYIFQLLAFNRARICAAYLQGGQGNLSADIVKSLKFKFPDLDEQQKIADSLAAMDAKIQAIADQVAKLQTFKKGLLQQMFV